MEEQIPTEQIPAEQAPNREFTYERRVTKPFDPVGAARRAETEARRRMVAQMVLAGESMSEIARRTGVNPTTIKRDVEIVRATWRKDLPSVEDMGAEAAARLNELFGVMRLQALSGNRDAAKIAVSIVDRLCKLSGCDAPVKREVHQTVDVVATAQFQVIQEVLLGVVEDLPLEHRQKIAAALAQIPALPAHPTDQGDDTVDAEWSEEDEDGE